MRTKLAAQTTAPAIHVHMARARILLSGHADGYDGPGSSIGKVSTRRAFGHRQIGKDPSAFAVGMLGDINNQ